MSDAPQENTAPPGLDQRVRQRLDDIVRFARAVAHELGGTMLPSRMDAPDLEAHPKWRRIQFQTAALIDHLRGTKAILDRFRSGTDDGNPATGFADWAAAHRPLLAALLRGGARLELRCSDDAARCCDAPWTRGVTALLLAIDEQSPPGGWKRVVLHVGHRDAEERVTLQAELDPPPKGPLVMPSCGLRGWGASGPAVWNDELLMMSLAGGGDRGS